LAAIYPTSFSVLAVKEKTCRWVPNCVKIDFKHRKLVRMLTKSWLELSPKCQVWMEQVLAGRNGLKWP